MSCDDDFAGNLKKKHEDGRRMFRYGDKLTRLRQWLSTSEGNDRCNWNELSWLHLGQQTQRPFLQERNKKQGNEESQARVIG